MSDAQILWGVVANARHNVIKPRRRDPLWALVQSATGQGSTSAAELCRRFGFDPDSTRASTDRAAGQGEAKC